MKKLYDEKMKRYNILCIDKLLLSVATAILLHNLSTGNSCYLHLFFLQIRRNTHGSIDFVIDHLKFSGHELKNVD